MMNRHDRNQYRQMDHHEAIVGRDIYNAAQKMLTATRYAKNGFPFPSLKVVDAGLLKGFVSVNRSWSGFSGEDYQKASKMAYDTEQEAIVEENRREIDAKFNLRGYEIVRAQFFSTRLNPAMTISQGKITFNTACMKKFKNVEYVEILLNSVENCIAVRPCEKDNANAVRWGRIRDGKWFVLPKSCRGFAEPLYELMNWNDACKYRFRAQYFQEADEQILLFNLEEPEVLKREVIRNDLPEEEIADTEVENVSKTIIRTLFPEQWRRHFGNKVEDVTILQRVHYYGNWDILRPARVAKGMDIISEEVLQKLNDEAQYLIEKMRCAV